METTGKNRIGADGRTVHPECNQNTLHEFLKLIRNELYLRANDDLYSSLARTDDARNASRLDFLLVYEQGILDLQTQTGDAVIYACDICRTAQAFQDDLCNRRKVIVCEFNLAFVNRFVIILTTRSFEVQGGDHDAEDQIEDDECCNAERDDEQGLSCRRQACREDQVGQTGREREAGTEAQTNGNRREYAIEQGINNIQYGSEEHECELKRLGNAADERAQCSSAQQAGSDLLLVGLGGVNHSQCSAGDTEHHAGEEAGHVHTEAVAVGRSGSASPELTEVVDADGVKPEYGVECVVQTEGNEQTVEESVDTSADNTQADDTGTQSNQSAVNDRPYEEQDGSHDDGNDCGNDCNAALTGEERECVGQLGVLELVVASSTDDTSEDTDELGLDLGESRIDRLNSNAGQRTNDSGLQELGHHQPRYQTGQTGGTIVVLCHTDGNADSEQPGHVVDQRAASLNQEEADDLKGARHVTTLHGGGTERVTDAHQDTADGQTCDGKHQRFAEPL